MLGSRRPTGARSGGRRRLLSLAVVLVAVVLIGSSCKGTQPFPGSPHWGRSTGRQTVVVFEMRVGSARYTPLVRNAAAEWDRHPHLDVRVGSCFGNVACVDVFRDDGWYPPGVCGGASPFSHAKDATGHGHFRSVDVRLDLSSCTLLEALYVTCHEMGHALGLDHDPSGRQPCNPSTGKPLAHDLNVLYTLYGHAHRGSGLAGGS